MYQRRVVGLVLTVASCVTIFAAVWLKQWWVSEDRDGSVHVGLRQVETCEMRSVDDYDSYSSYSDSSSHRHRRERCKEASLTGFLDDATDDDALTSYSKHMRGDDDSSSDDEGTDEPEHHSGRAFVVLGTLVFVAGLGAIVALIVAASTSRGPARPRPAALIAAIGCGAFAGLALAFMVSAPSAMNVRAGPGLAIALVGAVAGVAGALVLARVDPLREPPTALLADADRMAPVGRAPGLIIGALGAALVLGTLFTNFWFHGKQDGDSLSVGVQDARECHESDDMDSPHDGECDTQTIPPRVDEVDHPTRMKVFLSAGTLTSWTGLGAALAFAMIAVLLLFRQPVGGTFSLSNALYVSAIAFALASIVYGFSFPKSEEGLQGIGVSVGPFAAVGGAGCLVAAGVMIARWATAMQNAIPSLVPQSDPSQPNFAPMTYGVPTPQPVPTFAQPLAPMYTQTPPPGMYAPSPFAPPAPPPPSPPSSPSLFAQPSPFAPPAPTQTPVPFAPPPTFVPPPQFVPPSPPQPIYAPPVPVAQVVIPACPRCSTPMLWISARSAWQCTVCPRG